MKVPSFVDWIKENWWKIRFSHICYCLLVTIILYFVFGEIKYRYQKNHLEKLSPRQIVNLSFKAAWKEDHELLKKISHSSNPYTGEKEKSQVVKNAEGVQRALTILLAIKFKAQHQRAIEPDSVEVGYVHYSRYWPFAKVYSGMQVLVQEDDIWKLHSDKWKWGEMLEYLKRNPTDLSSYYLCSSDMANNQNFLLEYRFKKKYYELDPKGFWVTKSFLEELKMEEENYETNYKNYTRRLLLKTVGYPENWKADKARNYITLARIFMFHQDYQKAEKCLNEAENVLKQEKSEREYMKEHFEQVWNELQLRKEGKYIDPLDELDRLRAKHEAIN